MSKKVDVSKSTSAHSLRNRALRGLWNFIYIIFFRSSPKMFHFWRRFLLKIFGAKLGHGVFIYSSTRIWAPWNLEMGDHSCLAASVDCYNVTKVKIGSNTTVSQYSYLCAATHDIHDPHMRLVTAPIIIEDQVWVTADVFIAPGVTIGEGTVVGARSSVFHDLPPWKVCYGNPAKVIKDRVLK